MRAVGVGIALCFVAACGDNIIPESTPDSARPDAAIDAAIDAQLVDSRFEECPTDSVTEIQAGNPGATAADYPAPGWWSDDTRANGTVTVDDAFVPPSAFGCHSAHFVTGDTTTPGPSADKAQLVTFALAGTHLDTITTINYWAYRSAASTGGPAVDLALNVSITGASVPGNYASLTYEPYNQSASNAGVHVDEWQHWDATAITPGDGLWWTTKIANPANGSQAHPIPWLDFVALYPDAVVHGYGFNVGSFNPNMVLAGDGLQFGTTLTNF